MESAQEELKALKRLYEERKRPQREEYAPLIKAARDRISRIRTEMIDKIAQEHGFTRTTHNRKEVFVHSNGLHHIFIKEIYDDGCRFYYPYIYTSDNPNQFIRVIEGDNFTKICKGISKETVESLIDAVIDLMSSTYDD